MSLPAKDVSRRGFLAAFKPQSLALALTGGMTWVHVAGESRASVSAPRPPGAQDEPAFLASCIKCSQCVEACPYDTLQIATAGDGEAIGVPYFEPRKVPCEMCPDSPCTEACPTDALVSGTPIEEAEMGLAVLVDHENCLAYKGLRCEVCYRACPLMGQAIGLEFRQNERTGKHAYFIPVVNSDACTGCGKCEHVCVLEEAAIKVLPVEQARGKLGDNYRFGWLEETDISGDFKAPETAPDLPQWENSLERVLEQMDDLSGIEGP
ncbi:MAG: ferredoxin-type protein NapG [bacterium]|nr:ferredoxin-type protein NapG [bacterium]